MSVVLPVYGQTAYLCEAIQSLCSDPLRTQIIVVDDGCESDIPKLLNGLDVDYVRHEKNLGISESRNTGIRHARADLVTFFDQDDVLAAGGLSWRWQWFQQNPKAQILAGSVAGVIDGQGQEISTHPYWRKGTIKEKQCQLDYEFFRDGGLFSRAVWSYVFHRDLLEETGWFDPALKTAQDYDYIFRVLRKRSIPFVDKDILYYRLHGKNTTCSIQDGDYVPNPMALAECVLVNLSYGVQFRKSMWTPNAI